MKPLNPKTQAYLRDIFDMAFNVPSGTADVFVNWSPHCNNLSVSVHTGGWSAGCDPGFSDGIYLREDRETTQARALKMRLARYLRQHTTTGAEREAAKKRALLESADRLRREAEAIP